MTKRGKKISSSKVTAICTINIKNANQVITFVIIFSCTAAAVILILGGVAYA